MPLFATRGAHSSALYAQLQKRSSCVQQQSFPSCTSCQCPVSFARYSCCKVFNVDSNWNLINRLLAAVAGRINHAAVRAYATSLCERITVRDWQVVEGKVSSRGREWLVGAMLLACGLRLWPEHATSVSDGK